MSATGQKGKDAAAKAVDPLAKFKSKYWDIVSVYLSECEKRLAEITAGPGATLGESCFMTLAAGGKRLRPLLVFMSTARGRVIGEPQYAAAIAVELVHMATLVHDDILDKADLRRGQPTVVSKYGPSVSIAAGDYLFSKAFEVLSSMGSGKAVDMLSATSLDLSRGELMQMTGVNDLKLAPDVYKTRCKLKTSSLFATCCRLGAFLSGCSQKTIDSMGEFGTSLGLAFQISDDILDISGETGSLGKKFGADLRDGTITLPLILALKKDGGLARLLEMDRTEERLGEICARIGESGGLELAKKEAKHYMEKAAGNLASAAGELDIEPLMLIAEAMVNRET